MKPNNHPTNCWLSFERLRAFSLLAILLGLALSGTGCSTIQKVDFKPGAEPVQKHPVRVALVLENSFCKFEHHRDPEGYVYPLGVFLCPCARHLANAAFAKTTEYDSFEAAWKSPDADAVLTPRVVKIEIRARGIAWEKRHTLVVVEWALKNLKDQKTIWLATVEGRAEGSVGTMFSMDRNDRIAMQQAMDNVYHRSVEAFNQSEEINAFAGRLSGGANN
jgi:hypothetical protein